jgi:hypothetical protein
LGEAGGAADVAAEEAEGTAATLLLAGSAAVPLPATASSIIRVILRIKSPLSSILKELPHQFFNELPEFMGVSI